MPKKRKRLIEILEHDAPVGQYSVAAQNRAIILRLQDEIKEAVERGYSLLTIWKALHRKKIVNVTYQHFCRLVKSRTPIRPKTNKKQTQAAPAAADEDAPIIKVVRSKGFLSNTNFGVADPYGERNKDHPSE